VPLSSFSCSLSTDLFESVPMRCKQLGQSALGIQFQLDPINPTK
jgi:hypothetical protein